MRPEGFEPPPCRLKVCCAAVTPRPRIRSGVCVSIVAKASCDLLPNLCITNLLRVLRGESPSDSSKNKAVGREALESSSAVLQTAARPSQLSTPKLKNANPKQPVAFLIDPTQLEMVHAKGDWLGPILQADRFVTARQRQTHRPEFPFEILRPLMAQRIPSR